MSRNSEVLPVEVQHGTPVLPDEICLKLIEEIEQKKREAKGSIRIEVPEDDIELQSIWPQLSTVVKWLIENNNEDALEVLHLIIQKRTKELQRKGQEIDVTEALQSIIISLIREGINFDKLLNSKKRVQMTLKDSTKQEKEDSDFDVWTESVIQKFMNEEEVSEDNTSKEVTTNQHEEDGEELLLFKTTKAGDNKKNRATMSISIKAIILIEKDKAPIKVEDTHLSRKINQQTRTGILNLKRKGLQ
jgi:hypothetical protein